MNSILIYISIRSFPLVVSNTWNDTNLTINDIKIDVIKKFKDNWLLFLFFIDKYDISNLDFFFMLF